MCNPKSFSGFTIYIVEKKEERGREREREGRSREGEGGTDGFPRRPDPVSLFRKWFWFLSWSPLAPFFYFLCWPSGPEQAGRRRQAGLEPVTFCPELGPDLVPGVAIGFCCSPFSL